MSAFAFGQEANAEANVFREPRRKKRKRCLRRRQLLANEELRNNEKHTEAFSTMEVNRNDSILQSTSGKSLSEKHVLVIDKRENHLTFTQNWRELVFKNQANNAPLAVREQIFQANVKVLENGYEECSRNPAQWSKKDSHYYFCKMQEWIDKWTKQFMKERDHYSFENVLLVKDNIINQHSLAASRLERLSGLFYHALATVKFSENQEKIHFLKAQELNVIIRGYCNSLLTKLQFIVNLEIKDRELAEARKIVDEHREELRKTQASLNESQVKLNILMQGDSQLTQLKQQEKCAECLQVKERLDECQKQNERYVQELTEWENKLKKIHEDLRNVTLKSVETTRSKQRDMKEKLSQIRTTLITKQVESNPNCQLKTEILNKDNNEIFKDILALIQCETQPVHGNNRHVKTSESDVQTDGFLRVSEYEMHLVTLIASFLKVTPYPVDANYIYSYVAKLDNTVDLPFVEGLLKKCPSFFKEVAVAPGSCEKNWSYLDMKPVITI